MKNIPLLCNQGAYPVWGRHNYLTFRLASEGETYGIDIEQIREIIPMTPICIAPEAPDFVRGYVRLRGRMVPVFDLKIGLGMAEHDYDACWSLMIIGKAEDANSTIKAGIGVESVCDILQLSRDYFDLAEEAGLVGSKEHPEIIHISDGRFRGVPGLDRLVGATGQLPSKGDASC